VKEGRKGGFFPGKSESLHAPSLHSQAIALHSHLVFFHLGLHETEYLSLRQEPCNITVTSLVKPLIPPILSLSIAKSDSFLKPPTA
jgi:hypothetical protein